MTDDPRSIKAIDLNHRWQIKDERLGYSSPWVSIIERDFISPSGKTGCFHQVELPKDGTVILAFQDDKLLLSREYRPALDGIIWGLPGGRCEAGERPIQTAARELREETGLSASNLVELTSFYPIGAVMNHNIVAFLATDLQSASEMDQELESLHWVTLNDIIAMLRDQTIFEGPAVIALQHFLLFKDQFLNPATD